MTVFRTSAVLALSLLFAQTWVGCSSQVAANEPSRLSALWNGFDAEVRLVVYEDMNPNFNRRKVAYNADLSAADDTVKSIIRGLSPNPSNLHCNEDSSIYVLEITEAGNKRRYSSDNNHCQQGTSYAGYVPTAAMAQLAQAMRESEAY